MVTLALTIRPARSGRWTASCHLCNDWGETASSEADVSALAAEHLWADHVLVLGVGSVLTEEGT